MSRLYAIIISLIYMVGGLFTGYHAHMFRVLSEASESGIDTTMVMDFLTNHLVLIGPLLLILATLMHLRQIGKARKIDRKHVDNESALELAVERNKSHIESLERLIDSNNDVLDFCKNAIKEAAAEKALEGYSPPKDYAPNETPPEDEGN